MLYFQVNPLTTRRALNRLSVLSSLYLIEKTYFILIKYISGSRIRSSYILFPSSISSSSRIATFYRSLFSKSFTTSLYVSRILSLVTYVNTTIASSFITVIVFITVFASSLNQSSITNITRSRLASSILNITVVDLVRFILTTELFLNTTSSRSTVSFTYSSARTIRGATSCILLRFSLIIIIGIVYNNYLSYSRVISRTGSLFISLLSSLVSSSFILGVGGLPLKVGDQKMLLLGILNAFVVSMSLFGSSSRTKANVPPPL